MQRLLFVLNQIDCSNKDNLIFKSHNYRVHIDEKWFYLERLRKRFKIFPNCDLQCYDCDSLHHKSHRNKIMFTAAINEPFETNNGLIKILPHAKIEI